MPEPGKRRGWRERGGQQVERGWTNLPGPGIRAGVCLDLTDAVKTTEGLIRSEVGVTMCFQITLEVVRNMGQRGWEWREWGVIQN